MGSLLVTLTLAFLVAADPPSRSDSPRKPNPLAPSLPELTEEEEDNLDQIIDRFIRADSGKLTGAEANQAVADFKQIGPEGIPALIRGINRAAKIEHSCPAVSIAKKLEGMLQRSKDTELLQFARENIGAGITESAHMGVLKRLRLVCLLRKNAVERELIALQGSGPSLKGIPPAANEKEDRGLRGLTITELVEASGKERGQRLKTVLTELGKRRGDEVIGALGTAATTYDGEVQRLAVDLLARQLSDLSTKALKKKLQDDRATVRCAAIGEASKRKLHWEADLIERLTDEDTSVRQAARQALVKLAKGPDFGPKADATESERKEAVRQWQAWLAKQDGR
jgi:hypothetical protein